tara:strand:+ start:16145 stop:18379 length:2235 start_codon:yes stop_codon:yes gene_type:complete
MPENNDFVEPVKPVVTPPLDTAQEALDQEVVRTNLPLQLPPHAMPSIDGKGSMEDIFCVAKSTINRDPFLLTLGGSYIIDGDSITTQNNASVPFEAVYYITDFTGSADPLGGTTTFAKIIPTKTGTKMPASPTNTYFHDAFDVPVRPISTAKTVYGTYISDYEDYIAEQTQDPELTMMDVYGTVLSLGNDSELNNAARRVYPNGTPLTTDWQIQDGNQWADLDAESRIITYFRDFGANSVQPALNYKNVIYPHNAVVSANSAFALAKDSFPFYVNFNINMAPSGDMCKSLIDTKYADKFTANIGATISNGDVFTREDLVQQTRDGIKNYRSRVYDANLLATYDASSFISNSVVLGTEEDLKEAFPSLQPTFNDVIEALKYLIDLRNLLTTNALNFIDIASGKKCYSEVIVYRIAKFSEEDPLAPIQNFYFFNSPDASTFNFMDSQVVPGKMYNYKIYAYSFVAATAYEYDNITDEEVFGIAKVNAFSKAQIAETLISETRAFVTSLPPTSPEVEFRSFLGEEKQIQLLFQDSIQRIVEQPVILNQEERLLANRLRVSQGVTHEAPLTFFNDDETKVYEIYRSTVAPDRVDDFADKLSRRVTGKVVLEGLRSDQTYYYMFRTVDSHGNISNPSVPFEVTLIGGLSPYLLVNEYLYPFVAQEKKQKQKPFKRFMRVRPALQQLMLNTSSGIQDKKSSLDVNNVTLGVATDGKVWGKKYKIRVISKETGKKIDFNFKYDYNFDYREQ